MIKINDLAGPSNEQFNTVINGMRLSYKKTEDSDSIYGSNGDESVFILGDNDRDLLLTLCKRGSSHRKLLRQLNVVVDITAPLYFWKQLDAYKVGITTNSESTMHSLTKKPFMASDFRMDHVSPKEVEETIVPRLNELREEYLETENKDCWYAINELLPQSYLQRRVVSFTYESIVNYIQQRHNHDLLEHRFLSDYLFNNVKYMADIMAAVMGYENE